MKYKIGDRIKLIKDIWRSEYDTYTLSNYGLEKGKTYKIIDFDGQYIFDGISIGYNTYFIEDEKAFILISREMKLKRLLK